jgi:uncharacterized protein YprB with RNaseH-like and TPR domain
MYNDLKSKLELYKTNRDRKPCPQQAIQSGCDVQDLLEGTLTTGNLGTYFLVGNEYRSDHFHGGCKLGEALAIEAGILRKLNSDIPPELQLEDLLFLDTETTGLSGGTGTVAFLIGIGYFRQGVFTVRQYFMRDYDEEAAMLDDINNFIKSFGGLVTFNGKSFDWNLLQTRFTFNRIRCTLKEPYHLDLLYPSRRLWKLKLDSCSLSSLEENILGQQRDNDIPGAQIPAVYFKYVQDRDATEIMRVIKHNETDIVSMISLLVKISSMLKEPDSRRVGDYELLGLGSMFEAAGEQETVVECYERCLQAESPVVREQASKRLGLLYKRNRDYVNAVRHWHNMVSREGSLDIYPLIELAKYYEHRAIDYTRAIQLAETAMNRILSIGIRNGRDLDDLKKRLERLKRKASPKGVIRKV